MKTMIGLIMLCSAGICQQPGAQANMPTGTANAAMEPARAKYRDALALEAEYAVRNAAAQKQGYSVGRTNFRELQIAEHARVEAQFQLAAFDAGVTSSPSSAGTNREEALRKCRSLLEESITLAKAHWDYVSAQLRLGAAAELDLYEPRIRYARAVSRLAAWDAGALPLAVQIAAWEPRPPAEWPRPKVEIERDVRRTRDELRASASNASDSTALLKRRMLEQEIRMLQSELDAASKP